MGIVICWLLKRHDYIGNAVYRVCWRCGHIDGPYWPKEWTDQIVEAYIECRRRWPDQFPDPITVRTEGISSSSEPEPKAQ